MGVQRSSDSLFEAKIHPLITRVLVVLEDADPRVALAAAYAAGHMARAGHDVSGCVAPLRKLLQHEALGEAAAWSLAEFAEHGVNIAAAIADLVNWLQQPHDYSEPIRYGTSALFRCARHSPAIAKRVQAAVAKAKFPKKTKLIEKFLKDLRQV